MMFITPARRLAGIVMMAAICCAATAGLRASDVKSAAVTFNCDVTAATSLRVSNSALRIDRDPSSNGGLVVVGTVEYRAAARTRADGEVVLTVDTPADLEALAGGPASDETSISFEGSGEGARAGMLRRDAPEVAGRWIGGGVRNGTLTFTLRGPLAPSSAGTMVPLRFVLSLP